MDQTDGGFTRGNRTIRRFVRARLSCDVAVGVSGASESRPSRRTARSGVASGPQRCPLRSVFLSVYARMYEDDPLSLRIVRNIASRVQRLIELRNTNVHSTWFVGWASELDEDFSQVHGAKMTNTKTGVMPGSSFKCRFSTGPSRISSCATGRAI